MCQTGAYERAQSALSTASPQCILYRHSRRALRVENELTAYVAGLPASGIFPQRGNNVAIAVVDFQIASIP